MADEEVVFLEEAEDREREEDEEEGHLTRAGAGLVPTDFPDVDLEDFDPETILAATPDGLFDVSARRRNERAQQQLEIINQIQNQTNVDLSGVREELSVLQELDLDTATRDDLLANIASSNLTIAQTVQVMADTQVQLLNAMNNVLTQVEPFSQVTVSGTNDIDDADTAVEVVPGSDDTEIPTRILFIKASDDNKADIAFGDDEVDPSSGFILDKGENIVLNMDLRDITLWMASEDANAEVELLGLV